MAHTIMARRVASRPTPDTAVRRVLAALVALHGVAHLAGGSTLGLAAVWIALAVLFAAVAVLMWIGTASWPSALASVAGVSLVLTMLADAPFGVALNVGLLVVALRRRSGTAEATPARRLREGGA